MTPNMQSTKKWIAIVIAASVVATLATMFFVTGVEASTSNVSSIAQTIAQKSESHDAEGHSLHEVVYFVHPTEGRLYTGTVTFTASQGVDIFVYHDVTGREDQVNGFNVHQVDGRTYAVTSALKNATAGTIEFVGAGILAHVHVDQGDLPGDFNIAASVDAKRSAS